jgi:hypothetical protein
MTDRIGFSAQALTLLIGLSVVPASGASTCLTVGQERGDNLALGERRAQAVTDSLVSLGLEVTRLDTIPYGEERPLDPGYSEPAWALNRRAQFIVRTGR